MTAPRIDTVRNTTNQLIHRAAEALAHLEDLHTIGYYRHADQRAKDRVTGGDPTAVGLDLDNNGDPRYRAAYEALAQVIIDAEANLTDAIAIALTHFTAGTIASRRDTDADATSTEVLTAMANSAKRAATRQPGSLALVPQPLPPNSRKLLQLDRTTKELDDLRNAVRKTGIRPDRGRLTPAELTAWQTATGTNPHRRKRSRKRP